MATTHFDTSDYRRSHMQEPRGRGSWMFQMQENMMLQLTTESMTYTDARKAAKAWVDSLRADGTIPAGFGDITLDVLP